MQKALLFFLSIFWSKFEEIWGPYNEQQLGDICYVLDSKTNK